MKRDPIIFRSRIDPLLYNKEDLIKDLEYNYTLNANRHADEETLKGFPETDFHIYYKDWKNTNYKIINFDQLNIQYDLIVKDFIGSLKFKTDIEWKWYIVNINVAKNGFLAEHDHYDSFKQDNNWKYQFSVVHYLSLKSHHSTTIFSHSGDCNPSAEEDDVVIFSAYTKHRVDPSIITTDDLRITVSLNIAVKTGD